MPIEWKQVTWRGFSGRLHVYPDRVRLVDGWWTNAKGVCLSVAMNGSVVRVKGWPKKKRVK